MYQSRNAHFRLAAVVALALSPIAAQAVPIYAGGTWTQVGTITPGGSLQFDFEVTEPLTIDSFAVSGTGTNNGADVANLRFGFEPTPTTAFTSTEVVGASSAGFGFLPGLSFPTAPDAFTIYFTDGFVNNVGVTLSFTTEPYVPPIPLPASGIMLAFAVAGGAGVAMRKKKAQG